MSSLFSPISIKQVEVRNRIVMPPMVRMEPSMPREVVDTNGRVTKAVLEHYRRRAAAGTGMIIVEATAVDAAGRVWEQGLKAYADGHVPDLAQLAQCIRSEGAVANIQLVHGGPQASPTVSEHETVGPSSMAIEGKPPCHELTIGEIQAIEKLFEDAAWRAVEAGFDAVEIHGAHGYLLDSFLSSARNRRTDTYGGTNAGRMRMILETCRCVRSRIGERALLDCRISVHNHRDEGFSHDDLLELVQGLEGSGIDDAIWFKFSTDASNVDQIFDMNAVDTAKFKDGFNFAHKMDALTWWDVNSKALLGAQVELPNARFMNVGIVRTDAGYLVYIMWHEV